MSNLISAVFSPNSSFQNLREKGRLLLPLIVLSFISAIIIWIDLPIINKTILLKLNVTDQPISKETIILISQISAFAGAVISTIVGTFIIALLLLLVNTMIQGEAKFKKLVHVVLISMIPNIIGGLLTAILLRVTDADSLTSIVLSPGALLTEKKGILFALADLLNPFSIWSLVIIVIGTSIMANRSVYKVLPYIFSGWIILGTLFGLIGK